MSGRRRKGEEEERERECHYSQLKRDPILRRGRVELRVGGRRRG